MALDETTTLSIVELAIYTTLVPFTFYLFFKHGLRSTLGYLYLFAFESLRIVAAILQIAAHSNHHHGGTSTTGSIVSSVGLSPLILALSGFIYEFSSCTHLHHSGHRHPHALQQQVHRSGNSDRDRRLLIVQEVLVHLGAYTGIALAATGASNLAKSTVTPSEIDHARTLLETGIVLILVTWIGQVYMFFRLCQKLDSLGPVSVLLGVACLFVGVRCIYSVVYAFDHSPSVNPLTGKFAIKVTLVFLVQLVAVSALLAVGFLTRNIVIVRENNEVRRRWTLRGREDHGERYLHRPVEIESGPPIPLRSPK
ncbi:uncharacterized protein PV06_04474 [Exophiala oligosperma]|uniref:DUF7702 domain-containing protein n=1 Tax=Exophiala oligosperma TaxID=215243 RepID=A0A0D2DK62_9EURO|nr:uncharacterized protein PV06_04474 [Exophiala oligosperma]KIW43363.1 hypothetical protein PV06_04474 [Exophiala oligosperma]